MKILHYASHFSLLSETFIYDEIQALEKLYPRANSVLTAERHLEKERPYHSVAVLPQTPSLPQKLRRRFLKHFKGVRIPSEHFPLCSHLDRHLDSFDILQPHFGWNGVTVWQALKLLGREKEKPIIVRCQGSDINSNPFLYPDYKEQLLEMAASPNVLLTPNSECMRQKMLRLGIAPARIHPVCNAFNHAFLTRRKTRFFKPGDCLKLINTARFIEWKGQAYLVKGFARFVREVYGNSILTLIGAGETLDEVKHQAELAGVADKIRFLGGVPHPEIAGHLAESDLYIQPSIIDPNTFQEEGLPIAVLEALAVGLPLVVTRTGGMPEIVGTNNTFGRVIPDRDAEAIFQALRELFQAGTCFQDNSAYALRQLAAFSPEKQMADLTAAYARFLPALPAAA